MRAIDTEELARFRAGMRRRYSDEDILAELRAAAERRGRSPTMNEFKSDTRTTVHPQTIVERFGSWNDAKRAAGLLPRRFATRDDLLAQLRALGDELGRVPTARDIDARRESMPSKSLFWHTFGSLTNALREAGFDVPDREQRLERALEHGVGMALELRRLPKFADWSQARRNDPGIPTEWQVYRLVGGGRGAWATFQFLIRERLAEAGTEVAGDGSIKGRGSAATGAPQERRGGSGRTGAPRGRARRGEAPR